MFPDSESVKEHVVLRADAQTVSDQVHVRQDAVAIDHGRAFSGCVQA